MLPGTRAVELRRTNGIYKRLMEERLIKTLVLQHHCTLMKHCHISLEFLINFFLINIFLIKTGLFIQRVFNFYWLVSLNINLKQRLIYFKFETKENRG